jgi:hypothetical protein
MAKCKKYAEGDVVESESESLSIPEEGTGLKEETFSDAFKRNRASGEKTFEYKGKKYTTELAGEKKAAPKVEKKFSASESISAKPAKKAPDFMRKALGMKSGGSVGSASKRADGCAVKGKTRGKMV